MWLVFESPSKGEIEAWVRSIDTALGYPNEQTKTCIDDYRKHPTNAQLFALPLDERVTALLKSEDVENLKTDAELSVAGWFRSGKPNAQDWMRLTNEAPATASWQVVASWGAGLSAVAAAAHYFLHLF